MRIGAYWCVVNSVFTHCGPQYAKLGFARAPIRRIGAVPHTLTTGDSSSAVSGAAIAALAAMETESASLGNPSDGGPSTSSTTCPAPSTPLNPVADAFVSSQPGGQPVA